jgi:predicted short-subunit dehydrogenase-like oxidoreductase (DUF2520 family)
MNCCDYDCVQGRECPARVAKCKPVMLAAEPLPDSPVAGYLKRMASAMLVVLAVVLVTCMWIVLIAASAIVAPERRVIDCSLASFHPDFTPAMREACRNRKATQ